MSPLHWPDDGIDVKFDGIANPGLGVALVVEGEIAVEQLDLHVHRLPGRHLLVKAHGVRALQSDILLKFLNSWNGTRMPLDVGSLQAPLLLCSTPLIVTVA